MAQQILTEAKTLTEKSAKTVRLVYKIVLSVLTVVVAALFIMQTLRIYFGAGSYTRGLVATYLKQIAVPFWLWIAVIFIGFVLWEILPPEGKKKYNQDARYTLYRLKKKLPVKAEGELLEDAAAVAKRDKILKIIWGICAAACVIFAAAGLAYVCDFDNFPAENHIHEMVSAVINVLPYVICAFALCIGVSIYSGYSAKKVLPHMKRLVALGKAESPEYTGIEKLYYRAVAVIETDAFLWAMRAVCLIVGVTLVILGINNGGADDVLGKAINICTECIGLG